MVQRGKDETPNDLHQLQVPSARQAGGSDGGDGKLGERIARLDARMDSVATKEDVANVKTEIERVRTEVEGVRTELAKMENTVSKQWTKILLCVIGGIVAGSGLAAHVPRIFGG